MERSLIESTSCLSSPKHTIENCIIVWLLDTVDNNEIIEKSKFELQHIVNTIEIFENISTSLTYIETINNEIIFFIISGQYNEENLLTLHNLTQVDSIYFFDMPYEFKIDSINNYWKIKGIFTEINFLIEQLKKDIRQCEHNLIGTIFITNPTSPARSNKQKPDAMYAQLFQQTLRQIKDNNFNDMINYCREQYHNNNFILEDISTTEKHYQDKSPIWWYTKENFLYKILNKALRIQDINTLYEMRIYIQHIHEQITKLYFESHFRSKIILYRGQQMTKNDFEELKLNQGGLLFFSNFLLCNEELNVAKSFVNDSTKKIIRVIWIIEVNRSANNNIKFADIHKFSVNKEEKEWLFSIGSIFRIGRRMKLNNDGIWYVNLQLTSERDPYLNDFIQHTSNFIKSQNPLITLGKLMWEMGKYEQTEKFYMKALETEHGWKSRSGIFNRLGMISWKMNNIEKALDFYQKALEIDRQHIPENDPSFSSIYNNLGSLYLNQGELDLAEKYFKLAHQLDLTLTHPKIEWLSTNYNNLASVLAAQDKYSEALSYHERALKIRNEIFPLMHPLIALSHNNIAIMLMRLNRLSEAYEHAEKAVNIVSQSLLPTHPDTILYRENLDFIRQSIEKTL